MKKLRYIVVLVVATVAVIGCSSNEKSSESVTLNVGLAAAFVSDEAVENLDSYLNEALPEYSDDTKSISVTGITSGDAAADPFSVMAGTTRIGALMAGGDIELWITDPENALRYAEGGESYVTLDTLFSEDEISAFQGELVRIPKLDDEGNRTGDFSEVCGVDLSQNAEVVEVTGIAEPQMFIIVGSDNMDAAKAAFLYLARQ